MDYESIPQDQWTVFLNDISNRFQGWSVTIELLSGDLGDQRLAAGQPLQGISQDIKGPAAGDILITVGDEDSFETHRIEHPKAIQYSASQPGEQSDLQIQTEDGATTLIHFYQRPELEQPGSGIQAQP
jgi:hypothetical protein